MPYVKDVIEYIRFRLGLPVWRAQGTTKAVYISEDTIVMDRIKPSEVITTNNCITLKMDEES